MLLVTKRYTVTKQYVTKTVEYHNGVVVGRSVTVNRTPLTHGLVAHLAYSNLILDLVSYNKQNYTKPTNPWVGVLLFIVTDHIQG
jgi:hypothetical protein